MSPSLHDPLLQRTRALDRPQEAFEASLAAEYPDAAAGENVRIEAVAAEAGLALGQREAMHPVGEADEGRALHLRATETAVENWLALAEYWMQNGNDERARRTYRRVLDLYTGVRFEPYRHRAREGLQELKGLQADGGKAPGRDRRFRCGTAGQVVDGHLTLDGRERGL